MRITRETIQEWKNQGGWNDDWKLSHALIKSAGVEAGYTEVVDQFQKLFHGDGTNGLDPARTLDRQSGLVRSPDVPYELRRIHWPPALGS